MAEREDDDVVDVSPKNYFGGYSERVHLRAVYVLGFIAVMIIFGVFYFAYYEKPLKSEGLIAIASAAVGGIVGIFASSRE